MHMKIFISGATGFIGTRLLRDLLRRGDQVVALTRDARRLKNASLSEGRMQVVEGDPMREGPWQAQLAGCDAIIALHGEPIFGSRWTAALKQRAEDSRVIGTQRIVEALGRLPVETRPRIFLAGSAVGYYGSRGDEPLFEEAAPGTDFLAQLCMRWEAAAKPAEALGLRVCTLRIGLVLGDGGVLDKILPAFRAFVGGPIGDGQQQMPWIHLSDASGLIVFLLGQPEAIGPINVTAPEPVTMNEFARTLGEVLRRPSLFRVPALAVRALMGEASEAVLTGCRVLPRRAQNLRYSFAFPTLRAALSEILSSR
jgi:hypothetical protein